MCVCAATEKKERKRQMRCVSIQLRANVFVFGDDALKIIDSRQKEYEIPYRDIVLAYIVSRDGEGIRVHEIGDITEDMKGTLIIFNRWQNRFVLQADPAEYTAGSVFKKLVVCAPHALFGFQPWLNEYDGRQFEEAVEMVDIMRECVSLTMTES